MTVIPIAYNKDDTAIIFYVKHQYARCAIKCCFETGEAQVTTYNKSFNYELFVKARTILFNRHDFVIKTPKKFMKYE